MNELTEVMKEFAAAIPDWAFVALIVVLGILCVIAVLESIGSGTSVTYVFHFTGFSIYMFTLWIFGANSNRFWVPITAGIVLLLAGALAFALQYFGIIDKVINRFRRPNRPLAS